MGSTQELAAAVADVQSVTSEVRKLYPAVYRRFHRGSRHVAGTGVTPRMLSVLQHLANSGPLTITEAAEHFEIGKAATTELVDRLERKEFVKRMRDERDRRRVFLWLTAEGHKLASRVGEVLADSELELAIQRMTTPERVALITGLRALVRAGKELNNEQPN